MYLATNPPAFVMRSAQQRWYAPTISRMSSGSSRAESAVEPTRSQNMTVSWRRSAGAAGEEGGALPTLGLLAVSGSDTASFSPHSKQNLAPAGLACPHEGQRAERA